MSWRDYRRLSREDRLRGDKVAHLRSRLTRDPANERSDLGKSKVQFRCGKRSFGGVDRGFRSGNGGIRLFGRLPVGIKLALRNGACPRERSIALQVDLCEAALSLRLGELSFRLLNLCLCLIDSGPKCTRVDLKENLILGDRRTFPVILADQIPAYLRLNLRVDKSIESAGPIAGERLVVLPNFDHGDRNGSWRNTGRLAFTSAAAYQAGTCYTTSAALVTGNRMARELLLPAPMKTRCGIMLGS
jgi:hypothetical protein